MTDFLITSGADTEHYFFRPYGGICMRSIKRDGLWSDYTPIVEKAKDGFSVYSDKDGSVHLICVSDENELVYAVRKRGIWKKYALTVMNENLFTSKMRLYSVDGRLNLLYSALYNGENILVHCILGDRAKPSTVSALDSPHFIIYGKKAYYTDAQGRLGFTDLTDEKPDGFNPLYDNAHSCFIRSFGGKEILLFVRDEKLYIGDREILCDSRMEAPVCIQSANRIYVMWKSGGFIRYITSSDGGASFGAPMRFMNTGEKASLITVQDGDDFFDCYGYIGKNKLSLLGKPNFLNSAADFSAPIYAEPEQLMEAIASVRTEIETAKAELARLGKIISELKNQ